MRTSKLEQESFQVGEHTDVLGKVHLERAWEFCTCARTHTHTHKPDTGIITLNLKSHIK